MDIQEIESREARCWMLEVLVVENRDSNPFFKLRSIQMNKDKFMVYNNFKLPSSNFLAIK